MIPFYNVLPSEMALLRKHPQAGLANLLFGKPLVVEHEIEKDRIPKHRVLVCFIVDAYVLGSKQVRSSSVLHGYRHDYVYAKRQVFDLLRDLREAEELIRLRTPGGDRRGPVRHVARSGGSRGLLQVFPEQDSGQERSQCLGRPPGSVDQPGQRSSGIFQSSRQS